MKNNEQKPEETPKPIKPADNSTTKKGKKKIPVKPIPVYRSTISF
jgi:hypothetical protein